MVHLRGACNNVALGISIMYAVHATVIIDVPCSTHAQDCVLSTDAQHAIFNCLLALQSSKLLGQGHYLHGAEGARDRRDRRHRNKRSLRPAEGQIVSARK